MFSFVLITFILAATMATASPPALPCIIDRQSPNTDVNGSVDMTTNALGHLDAPMVTSFNSTVNDDYSFDAVSSDGTAAMAFTFSRGTIVGHPLAQRLFISVVWPNGTRYMETTYAEESIVRQCHASTVGTWYNTTSGMNWTFDASKDFSKTVVTVDSSTIKGTYTLHARSPSFYPDGSTYPNLTANTLFAPYLYWTENVPTGIATANLTIKNTPFILKGYGGRERNWNSFAWSDISKAWDQARATIGPYTLMIWTYDSKITNQPSFTSVLMRGKEVIFRTQSTAHSNGSPYSSINSTNTGSTRLSSPPGSATLLPESDFTGYVMEMVYPSSGKAWRFEIEFTRCIYWFRAGKDALIGGFVGNGDTVLPLFFS